MSGMSDHSGPDSFHSDDDKRVHSMARPAENFATSDAGVSYAPMARPAEDIRYPRLLMTRGAAALDVFLIVALLAAFYSLLFMFKIPDWAAEHLPMLGMLWTNVLLGSATLDIVGVILLLRRQKPACIGLGKASVGKTIGLALIAMPVCYAAQITAVTAFLTLTGSSFEDLVVERSAFFEQVPHIPPLVAVAFSLFVGVHEEVLFRGFILGRLRAIFGSTPVAVIVSSVIFGMLHGYQGMVGVVQTTTVGLVLATIAARFRTIWPTILAHGMVDGVSLVLLPLLGDTLQEFAKQITTTQASP